MTSPEKHASEMTGFTSESESEGSGTDMAGVGDVHLFAEQNSQM